MKKMISFLGVPEFKNNKIIIDISYIDSKEKERLIESIKEKEAVEFVMKKASPKKVRTYEQLKLWFSMIEDILIHYQVPRVKDNQMALSEDLKQYFPTRYVSINNELKEIPKSISDSAEIPSDEFARVTNEIFQHYRSEGVLFKVDRGEKF